jgi:amino acid transporter
LKRFFLGEPLQTEQLQSERLPIWKALPILSPDALSSISYGPEVLLRALLVAGTVPGLVLGYSLPIGIAIISLLVLLILSYRQVIFQYPQGGGAYKVSYDNLGRSFGLVSGAALLIDYTLTVAVSVSAGKDALLPIFPALASYATAISICFVLIIMMLNLRGLRKAGNTFALPTYLFIVGIVVLIFTGLSQVGIEGPSPACPLLPRAVFPSGLTWFILLKAFSSGCASLTGVDAIANAAPYFRKPAVKRCSKALIMLGLLLGSMVAGVLYLTYVYGLVPPMAESGETLLSLLAAKVFGVNTGLYIYIQAVTTLLLILAANTGFSGFPLLAAIMAKDNFLPRMFANRGDRLSYSNGIMLLAFTSIVLIWFFGARVDKLIPLYAVGVFLSFTLAQASMVIRWIKQKGNGWQGKLLLNAVGAFVSFCVFVITLVTKFTDGACIVVVLFPILIYIFLKISKHYKSVAEQLRLDPVDNKPIALKHLVIMPVGGINRVVSNTISYAKSLQGEIVAFYVGFDQESIDKIINRWQAWQVDIELKTCYSKYRSLIRPLLQLVSELRRKENYGHVTILIPEFIVAKWWHRLLHNQTALILRFILMAQKNVAVATVPFHLSR